jgi:hypothetical protein
MHLLWLMSITGPGFHLHVHPYLAMRADPYADTPAGTTGYTWSPRGTLASTTTTPSGGTATTTQQKFDAFNQLIGNGGQAYSYDALGRRPAAAPPPIRSVTRGWARNRSAMAST